MVPRLPHQPGRGDRRLVQASPTTHRFYDVTVVVSPGDPRLVTFLHAAAIVCGFGGWLVAAMLVGRVATRRTPATAAAIRTGVWLSRIGTGATVLLRLAISVYVAALALQPWRLGANHSCDDLPRALWAAGSCAPYSAPAGRAVLTGPLEGAAPFWIVLTLACAALAVVGTRIAGRSAKKAALLDATLDAEIFWRDPRRGAQDPSSARRAQAVIPESSRCRRPSGGPGSPGGAVQSQMEIGLAQPRV